MPAKPEIIPSVSIPEVNQAIYELLTPGSHRHEHAREFRTLIDQHAAGKLISVNSLAWQIYLGGSYPEDLDPNSFIARRARLAERLDFFNIGKPILLTSNPSSILYGILGTFDEGDTTRWITGYDPETKLRDGRIYTAVEEGDLSVPEDQPVTAHASTAILLGSVAVQFWPNKSLPIVPQGGFPYLYCYLGTEEIADFLKKETAIDPEMAEQVANFMTRLEVTTL